MFQSTFTSLSDCPVLVDGRDSNSTDEDSIITSTGTWSKNSVYTVF